MAMNVEAEIRDLKRRVSEREGFFGFLIQQVRSVHKDLLAFQAKVEQRFEKIEGRLDRADGLKSRHAANEILKDAGLPKAFFASATMPFLTLPADQRA